MVTVKLWGGLGNQLFQYAYGYQLAKKLNTGIVLDTSWFRLQNLREPEILKLQITYDAVECTWDKSKAIALLNKPFVNRLIRIPPVAKYRLGKLVYFKESRFHYSSQIHSFRAKDAYIDGYWQCPRYFENLKADYMRMFTPASISEEVLRMGEMLRRSNSVAIHVRRGDYPSKKVWYSRLVTIQDAYYQQAVAYMEAHNPGCSYYLFSNDRDDAKAMLSQIVDREIMTADIPNLTAMDEWYLMSCCQHQIIGNSTFSWWSAYLNKKPEKIVCAPNYSLGNDDMIPADWVAFGSREELEK